MINNESFQLVGIIGNPLKQSMSPFIHNYWIKKYKINSIYLPFQISSIKNIKNSIKTLKVLGLNVTVPYKKKILSELDLVDTSAKNISAVNTIIVKGRKVKGYNTDILGFKEGLVKKNWNKAKPVIVYGAGGAAEAIIHYLKLEKVKNIFITNRTEERAIKLIKNYDNIKYTNKISQNLIKEAGLIINTTCLGMIGYPSLELDLRKVNREAIIYDIVYNPINTKLIKDAKKQKLSSINGLDMFIEQAKCSFKIWFNVKPETDKELITLLKKKINNS